MPESTSLSPIMYLPGKDSATKHREEVVEGSRQSTVYSKGNAPGTSLTLKTLGSGQHQSPRGIVPLPEDQKWRKLKRPYRSKDRKERGKGGEKARGMLYRPFFKAQGRTEQSINHQRNYLMDWG